MPVATKSAPSVAISGDYPILLWSFQRSLRAENESPRTVQNYMESSEKFGAFLAAKGMPTNVAAIRREHVESFIAHQWLIAVGNCIGHAPYFMAEGDRHGVNLFGMLVGDSSKGRKGTSWGHVQHIMDRIDPAWTQGRVMDGLRSREGLIQEVRDPIFDTRKTSKGEIQEEQTATSSSGSPYGGRRSCPLGGNLSDDELSPLVGRLAQAIFAARMGGQLQRDAEADALWCEIYDDLSEGQPGMLGTMTARSEAQTMRLAYLYALLP
jgi:hypothetical protein